MTDFKGKIGAKEALLDVQVIVLPLLNIRYPLLIRCQIKGIYSSCFLSVHEKAKQAFYITKKEFYSLTCTHAAQLYST